MASDAQATREQMTRGSGDVVPGLASPALPTRRWLAELELWFGPGAGKTRLLRRRHVGPLLVQRPFHPEKDGTCHVYLLPPPAGVVGGDSLDQRFYVEAGARAVLTTPGATRFYRSNGETARQSTLITVGAGAVCEYLPQETIVFEGANARLETKVSLAADAVYVGWDFVCLGRPASGEGFQSGQLAQRIDIVREGRPIWYERLGLDGGDALLTAQFAMAGQPTAGAMVYAGPLPDDAAERVHQGVGAPRCGAFSVSQLDDVLVCRYLGPRVADGRALFIRAWDVLRVLGQGKAACAPRIWAT